MFITNMNEQAAKQICSWEYEYPYSVYNYYNYEEALQVGARIIQSQYADDYLCFWNDDKLEAYISYIFQSDRLYLGISLSPDCCGKGMGKEYLLKGIQEAYKKYGTDISIWLKVRSWNKRAVKCYLSCGFIIEYAQIAKNRFNSDEEFCFMKYYKEQEQ